MCAIKVLEVILGEYCLERFLKKIAVLNVHPEEHLSTLARSSVYRFVNKTRFYQKFDLRFHETRWLLQTFSKKKNAIGNLECSFCRFLKVEMVGVGEKEEVKDIVEDFA